MVKLQPSTVSILFGLFGLFAAGMIVFGILEFAVPQYFEKAVLTDFDAFHLAGTMILEGNLADAYNAETYVERQQVLHGAGDGVLYWSYPPPFNFVAAALGTLPIWISFGFFMSLTFLFYLFVMRALAGPSFFVAVVPMVALWPIIIRSGQNSFLTGGLICLTCLLVLRQSRWAGVSLGMMILKPHLALGVGLWSLFSQRWWLALSSILTVCAICLLATIVFGSAVWAWFFAAAETAQQALRDGALPLFRMSSMFTFGLSVGLDQHSAMIFHVIFCIVAIAALVILMRALKSVEISLGAAVFVSALLSPYNFDYDLAMLGAAACLFAKPIGQLATRIEKLVLLITAWALGLYGLGMSYVDVTAFFYGETKPISIVGPGLFLVGAMVFKIVYRARTHRVPTS